LRPDRRAPVGAHDSVPREIGLLVVIGVCPMLGEYSSDHAWRTRIDIAIGPHESLRDRADQGGDAITASGGRRRAGGARDRRRPLVRPLAPSVHGAITSLAMRPSATVKSHLRSGVPPGKLPVRRPATMKRSSPIASVPVTSVV
jgi:hypothetical protein